MKRLQALFLGLLLAGCASDPLARLETTTPTLTAAQVATLQRRAQSPEALGIEARLTPVSVAFGGVNQLDATGEATVPLVKFPRTAAREAGEEYRLPVILAKVNGRDHVRVLLDSGSNRNLLGYTLANALDVPIVAGVKPMTGLGIGGAAEAYAGIVPQLDIGAVRMQRVVALVGADAQALGFTRGLFDNKQVMILGLNALRGLSYVSIDYRAGTVTLAASETYTAGATATFATRVPMWWDGDLPFVDVKLDAKKVRPCIVDTGGDYGFLVPRAVARELGYWKPGKERLNTAGGIGGASLGTSYTIREATLGGATFKQIRSRTDLVGPEPAGGRLLLGNAVLRQYRVTFDFRQGLLWLER